MQSLSDLHPGESGQIQWMFGAPGVLEFLRSRNVKEGSLIQVFQRSRENMIIGLEDLRLAISMDVAQRIKV